MEILILKKKKGTDRLKRLKQRVGTIIAVYPDFKCREPVGDMFYQITVRDLDYNRHTYFEDRAKRKSRAWYFKFWRLPGILKKELKAKGKVRLTEQQFLKLTKERKWL